MDLSIVILNWKVKKLLQNCLTSIYEQTKGIEFEVFVVDNNSQDGSVEMVQQNFPQVNLIANHENLGFAKGNNQALLKTRGKFVILLNPDTEFFENSLTKMLSLMNQRLEIGILGPKILNQDKTLQYSVRGFPTFCVMFLMMLKIHNILTWIPCLRRYFLSNFNYELDQPVDQVMGAAFMIRRDVLQKVGLLDERFFIWFEEVDYCQMAKNAGFQVWYSPCTAIIHHGGESFAQTLGLVKQRYLNNSILKYERKHGSQVGWLMLAATWPISMMLTWLVLRFNLKIKIK